MRRLQSETVRPIISGWSSWMKWRPAPTNAVWMFLALSTMVSANVSLFRAPGRAHRKSMGTSVPCIHPQVRVTHVGGTNNRTRAYNLRCLLQVMFQRRHAVQRSGRFGLPFT